MHLSTTTAAATTSVISSLSPNTTYNATTTITTVTYISQLLQTRDILCRFLQLINTDFTNLYLWSDAAKHLVRGVYILDQRHQQCC